MKTFTICKSTYKEDILFFLWQNGTSQNEFQEENFKTKKEAISFCKKNNINYK